MTNDTQTTQAAQPDAEAARAQKEKIGSVQLTEVTSQLFSGLKKGQICRFGEGWIFHCSKCDTFIYTDEEFKSLVSPKQVFYRLSPSIVCPNPECDWHMMVTIKPEDDLVEIEEENERDPQKKEDDTQPAAGAAGGQVTA